MDLVTHTVFCNVSRLMSERHYDVNVIGEIKLIKEIEFSSQNVIAWRKNNRITGKI